MSKKYEPRGHKELKETAIIFEALNIADSIDYQMSVEVTDVSEKLIDTINEMKCGEVTLLLAVLNIASVAFKGVAKENNWDKPFSEFVRDYTNE